MFSKLLTTSFFLVILTCNSFKLKFSSTKFNALKASLVDSEDYRIGGSEHPRSSIIEELCLPRLSYEDEMILSSGQRLQKQTRYGREGYGLVVVDVPARSSDVFRALCDYQRYSEMIPTVRSSNIITRSGNQCSVEFQITKLKLPVNIKQNADYSRNAIYFSLDTERPNLILRKADGLWYVESLAERPDYSRVWLNVNVIATRLLPTTFIDMAASKALPKATAWLQSFNFENYARYCL